MLLSNGMVETASDGAWGAVQALMDPLFEFTALMRTSGAAAAHAYLDAKEQECVDTNLLHHIALSRVQLFHDKGRYDEAIRAARTSLATAACKSVLHGAIALALYRKGDAAAAEAELEAVPVEAERERFEARVLEAEYLRLFLRNQRGIAPTAEEFRQFPPDYRQVTDRGERHGLEALGPMFRGRIY
ncbi:hypothetical protein [Rhizobium halophytocola]|uniref:Tetratricopeptide repeat protein n=1 Tax=Rhizobium halophytocola TaxID=735519 RepID=A0ABS4DYW1_9HYPH|nr:hypothetical protein [Rhizobium halophytocola]MBP1850877.1 hypothetical protein [Rhizobium halophytocola]